MADGSEKLLECSICKLKQPVNEYSSKQLKRKGKRVCRECVAAHKEKEQETKASGGSAPRITIKNDPEKLIVKNVSADDVRRAQERMAANEKVEDKALAVFQEWLKGGGAKYPNLLIKSYTVDYRGVHAKNRLKEDQIILEVPLKMLITTEVAKASDIGKKIAASGCEPRSSHSWLAAYLLQEKHNPQSYWKPYIDTLPQHYRNMPIFFDDDELAELKGSFSLNMIEDRKISLKMEYDHLCSFVEDFKQFHHLEFVWARLAVITRIFGFDVDAVKTDGLVPMADMLNHKRPNETSWKFDQGLRGFTITTTKTLLKGAQIFDSYGRKCNSRYFVNYGFSLEENEDNQVAMLFDLVPPEQDPTCHLKAGLLGGAHTRRFQIPFDHLERVCADALSWLRVAHADQSELKQLIDKKVDWKHVEAFSLRNENAVMQEIAKQAVKVLAGFPTTLAQDLALLNDTEKKLTMNIRNCILMRKGEKEVLHAYIDFAEKCNKFWNLPLRDFRRFVSKEIKDKGRPPSVAYRTEHWVEEIWSPLWTGEKVELRISSNAHEGT